MEKYTEVTETKIKWLVNKGYVTKKVEDGNPTYYITTKGKEYLNDAEKEK